MPSDLDTFPSILPPRTPVRVIQSFTRGPGRITVEVTGVVEQWRERPSGSWFAHGRKGAYWLTRLLLRKDDGELTELVMDNSTAIERMPSAESQKASSES
jgi:hypothetical protein